MAVIDEAPPSRVRVLSFAGDVSLTHGIEHDRPFQHVRDWLRASDLAVGNLETTVGPDGVGAPASREFVFRSPPESVAMLADAGLGAVGLANNHALDFGPAGLVVTMRSLEAGSIAYAGASRASGDSSAWRATVLDVRGVRVALLSFERINTDWGWHPTPLRAGIASVHGAERELRAIEAIREAKSRSDVVVVLPHWGTELLPCPHVWQRQLARAWVEAGADLVLGSHPHVLQGIERVGPAWVAYSMGNFVFPSAHEQSADGALFEFTVGPDAPTTLRLRPVVLIEGTPHPADATQFARVRRLIATRSWGAAVDAEGRVGEGRPGLECR